MQKVRIGLIGTGYIGRCHAIAYAQVATVFPLKGVPVLEMLAEVTPELARQRAAEFGFSRSTANWQELVVDPVIDVVDICAPNFVTQGNCSRGHKPWQACLFRKASGS